MGKIFDFKELVQQNVKKHKMKPPQFESVTGGVQKRLENNLNRRKSNRLSVFDRLRSITKCESPAPLPFISKQEHRRQQFEKWKVEKERRKKEEAAKKKKPFLIGAPRAPLKFFPPPPLVNKVLPSTSGPVTRSRAAQNAKKTGTKEKEANARSFAPENASFHPPAMKNILKLPVFGAPKAKKDSKLNSGIRFEPLLPDKEVKQTRSKTKQKTVETRATRKQIDTNNKVTKQVKPANSIQSSSSLPKQNVVKTKTTSKPINNKSKPTQSDIPKEIYSKQSSSTSDLQHSTPSPKPKNTPNRKKRKSLKPRTPKNSIPKSESSSEERLRSPKSSEDAPINLEQIEENAWKISPKVTVSRGKDSARKEIKMKLKEGLLDEDASDMDNVDIFRKQLANEIKRITERCDTWDRIFEQTELPEAVQEHVLGAVGQARLLMSQKLVQFASLIERCARPEPGTSLVTPADLHGFWDMVYMQVENVDIRFNKLEEMRSRGWQEEPVVKPRIVKPAVKPTVKPAGGHSRLKEMIAAARKAKKEQAAPPPATEPEKTFEAGFFRISSPVRSSAPSTPNRKPSLLKAVLSNEAKKSASKQNTPFAMLRASALGKNMECEGVAPLPVTPKPQMVLGTPGRSILKNSTKKSAKKSAKKSIKTVLFNELETSMEEKTATVTEIEVPSIEVEQKENTYIRRSGHREDGMDGQHPIGVMTRRMRKSMMDKAEEDTSRTPGRILAEIEKNVIANVTPKRSSRRRRTEGQITRS